MKHLYILFISLLTFSNTHARLLTDTAIATSSNGYMMRPNLLINLYTTRNTTNQSPKRQEFSYNYQEISVQGYFPVLQKNYLKNTNTAFNPNLALLATGSIAISKANFDFTNDTRRTNQIEDIKPFTRVSLGLRGIYFDGNKSIFMASFSPFISESGRSFRNIVPRFFASALYSRAVSEYFSYRIGVMFTYLYDGGSILPLVGFRVGDYNKIYFNFQLPRDISLNFRISRSIWGGVFTRLNGGIYRFTTDTPINDFRNDVNTGIVLYRQELLSGLMLNYAVNSNLYFSLNMGISTNRRLSIAQTNELKPIKAHLDGFVNELLKPTLFLNFSVSYFFGKPTYSSGYNYMIEEKALNNSNDVGDFNIGNNQINNDLNMVKPKDISKKDIKKLNASYLDLKDVMIDE